MENQENIPISMKNPMLSNTLEILKYLLIVFEVLVAQWQQLFDTFISSQITFTIYMMVAE